MDNVVKAKMFVGTPMYAGLCNGSYTLGMMNATAACSYNNVLMYYSYTQNESLITRGRNRLAYEFLSTDCTHLMFIDADIGFDANDIIKMIDADKEIICGMYPKKEIDWPRVKEAVENGVPVDQLQNHTGSFVVNFAKGERVKEVRLNEPFEIENGGTGFMLIKREVFEMLKAYVPTYKNDMQTAVEFEQGAEPEMIHEFFATSINKDQRLLSEDYHFCELARSHGVKIWAAPWAKLSHTGTYTFQGNIIRS
jgi:hypothetical protein